LLLSQLNFIILGFLSCCEELSGNLIAAAAAAAAIEQNEMARVHYFGLSLDGGRMVHCEGKCLREIGGRGKPMRERDTERRPRQEELREPECSHKLGPQRHNKVVWIEGQG